MPKAIIQKFKNDYNQTCHPAVLEALSQTCQAQYAGYGEDAISVRTRKLITELCHCPSAHVHFLAGGTLTNLLTISAFLRPHQAVIAAESGHINVHETGAIEATGHKVLTVPAHQCPDGKLRQEHIEQLCAEHDNEHMVQARMVYISQATELGSVYSKAELTAIAATCKKLGLYLFVDGARLGCALTAQDAEQENLSLADLAALCDAFYIGGTKNGALFGEALVLVNEKVQKDFRYLCKQRGAMLAKGWLVAAQFEALLRDGLYFALARHANTVAKYIDTSLKKYDVPLLSPTYTNQIFPILPIESVHNLAQSHAFETWSRQKQTHTIRFVTSWGTSMEEATTLLHALNAVL